MSTNAPVAEEQHSEVLWSQAATRRLIHLRDVHKRDFWIVTSTGKQKNLANDC